MDDTLKIIITSVTSILVAFITAILPLYQKNKKLKREMKYITTGMVVAYFFSFIKPLFDKLEIQDIVIRDNDNEILSLIKVNKKLELVIPKTLDHAGYTDARNYVNDNFKQGSLVKGSEVIFRNIKFRKDITSNNAIIVIDAPLILESAVNYFKESMRTTDFSISDDFKLITGKELSNFKNEIERMIANSEFNGRVNIIQI